MNKIPLVGLQKTASEPPPVVEPQYQVVELNRDDPLSVSLLLPFIDRCLAFCEKYHSDTPPNTLRNWLFEAFHSKSTTWKLLVALDADNKIVAHCIADIEAYGDRNVVFILQIEKDVQASSIMDEGFRILREWANKYKITRIMNYTLSEAHAKLYEKEYGFKTYRWVQKLDME